MTSTTYTSTMHALPALNQYVIESALVVSTETQRWNEVYIWK